MIAPLFVRIFTFIFRADSIHDCEPPRPRIWEEAVGGRGRGGEGTEMERIGGWVVVGRSTTQQASLPGGK